MRLARQFKGITLIFIQTTEGAARWGLFAVWGAHCWTSKGPGKLSFHWRVSTSCNWKGHKSKICHLHKMQTSESKFICDVRSPTWYVRLAITVINIHTSSSCTLKWHLYQRVKIKLDFLSHTCSFKQNYTNILHVLAFTLQPKLTAGKRKRREGSLRWRVKLVLWKTQVIASISI